MITILLLSIALSLDAFAVSFAHGLQKTRIPLFSKLIICLCSIAYFGLSALLGRWIAGFLSPGVGSVMGILLMAVICLYMLLSQLFPRKKRKEKPARTLVDITLKSLHLSIRVIRDPITCDLDGSHSIGPLEAVLLGTAVSIDSVNIGLGFALMGGIPFWAPLAVGGCQFLLVWAGNGIGLKCGAARFRHTDKLPYLSIAIMFLLLLIRSLSL